MNLSNTPVGQRPTLRQGDSGEWVRELQRELTQLTFYNGPINGTFNAATADAVRAFQRGNNLTVDGVVGRNTWSSLIFLYHPLAICGGSGLMPVPFIGVVIDPGHGGTDPGAVGNDIIEKDLNLAISMYQDRRLYELNINHYLTRKTDITLTPTERLNRIRSAYGDERGVILISNHINAGGGQGAEVIYALRSQPTFPQMILNEIRDAGQIVRRIYQRALPNDPTRDYYFLMRETTNLEPVIVEYGFLDNVADATRLRYNWQRYAEAVIKALCDYIGYPYQPPYRDEIVYTVRAGDTLFAIANRFQTTVDEIMRANNLTSTNISVGQILKIPFFSSEPPEELTTYTVIRGDTLFSIANRFNTTVEAIVQLNNLTSTALSIGQQLLIPGQAPPPRPPIVPPVRPIIRQGDRNEHVTALQTMLNNLGFSLNTDGVFGPLTAAAVRSFQTNNNLTADGIVGPATWNALASATAPPPPEQKIHIVQAGDTLFSIARSFRTTVDEIIRVNNLTSTTLSIGQQLIIPDGEPITQITHTVVRGDTLFALAQRYNTTVNDIIRVNNLTSTALSIGQQLLIPT